jgi:riboflavin kinase/FMN adenylyltransferase
VRPRVQREISVYENLVCVTQIISSGMMIDLCKLDLTGFDAWYHNDARGAAVAIGNFDGVHLGHQDVMDVARAQATKTNAPLGILTFEPHPRSFFAAKFNKELPPFRLMSAEARAHRLEKLGVDLILELPFNQDLCDLSDWEFSRQILSKAFGLSHVVVGADFCFGKGRLGTAASLSKHASNLGFDVTIADLKNHDAQVISSTNIPNALAAANPRRAAAMLGHWHRLEGPVEHGEKRGRELGYPTANMSIDGLHPPAFGVYAVLADILDGPHRGSYHGVASIGVRPMFGENKPNIETFVFDFSGDLYGAQASVALVAYLRGEENFDGLETLIKQMDADSAEARKILGAL